MRVVSDRPIINKLRVDIVLISTSRGVFYILYFSILLILLRSNQVLEVGFSIYSIYNKGRRHDSLT